MLGLSPPPLPEGTTGRAPGERVEKLKEKEKGARWPSPLLPHGLGGAGARVGVLRGRPGAPHLLRKGAGAALTSPGLVATAAGGERGWKWGLSPSPGDGNSKDPKYWGGGIRVRGCHHHSPPGPPGKGRGSHARPSGMTETRGHSDVSAAGALITNSASGRSTAVTAGAYFHRGIFGGAAAAAQPLRPTPR